jgi:hypothetical protein
MFLNSQVLKQLIDYWNAFQWAAKETGNTRHSVRLIRTDFAQDESLALQ